MTHDELLALLNAKSDSDEVHALRAIVELHTSEFDCLICPKADGSCPTIQAIEKELR